ncbi:alkaline phosphatase family protein [Gloeobacter kilaueensis]|uniref:Type I phosphodiesterase/nucleotide pyrophosphatase n=1 Tax=Gloeobacter kilaueensis (strain ATCC BAA-2537 / CCAP 1431/1 / ULC 316 / JS1) TaxID=1183438 RepID=U5QM06_GLOK1|nr:alkaline phosphatase family protein [Gloeobacter kilaueensis]AGY59898.1 type I phosphodiesterase/nucleotide pyrophosphatase [Gloeobacter kilaueensis JS1]
MTRTLAIGMDGATFTILDQMVEELPGLGLAMPFMKKIFEGGARSRLLSTPNPLTPPAWVSFMTGRTPGNHGVYDFIRMEEKGDDVFYTLYDARDVQTEMIWSIATRSGKKVVALNYPFTAPPRPNTGSLVPGFTHWKHLRRSTSPPELYERLKEMPDFSPKNLAWDFEHEKQIMEALGQGELADWIRYHIRRDEHWLAVAEKLLVEDQPDLMAVLFDGTDKLQHQIYYYLDPNLTPEEPSDAYLELRALSFEYFRKLDSWIERLVELAGPDTQVFLNSDHGFTASFEVVRINAYLADRGYLVLKAGDGLEDGRPTSTWFANVDFTKTRAYCPTPSSNGIVIRVASKPGEPGIAPEEYEAFRDQLIADLYDLRDAVTGEQIIKAVRKREEIYNGPALADAPDLTLTLRDHGFVSIRDVRPVVEKRPEPLGTHHPEGVFLAYGPGIRPGYLGPLHQIADVPATLLYSLGLPIPDNFEGKVAQDFFNDEYLMVNPVRTGSAALTGKGASEENAMDEAEKAKLLEQLQMLGYVE